MCVFQNFLFVLLIPYGFALQNQYKVVQENVTITDLNDNLLDIAAANVFQLNETTNGLNLTFTLKFELPFSSKISATALKWINGEYKLGILNIFKGIPAALQMEMFDLQGLFVDHCNPPMVWPLGKGVRHRCFGWSPDSTKFPPHLPAGRYKVPIAVLFANNTKIVVINWYLKLIYKK